MKKFLSTLFIMFTIIAVPFGLRTAMAQGEAPTQINFVTIVFDESLGQFCVGDLFPIKQTGLLTDVSEELAAAVAITSMNPNLAFRGIMTQLAAEKRGEFNCGI